jgi:hypothetical protein
VVLYLTYPFAGETGLCAVVPEGKDKNPVLVFALSDTPRGASLPIFTAVTAPSTIF